MNTVSFVDISKYLGQWYEISRLPNKFQRVCESDVMAQYEYGENNEWVKVTNSCTLKNGKTTKVTGRAYIADTKTNSKLKVNFAPVFLHKLGIGFGKYWILDLGEQYEYALVGSPNLKFLWVLSRTKKMDSSVYNQILQKAKSLGFDADKMVLTTQT